MSAVVNKFDKGTPYCREKIALAKGANQAISFMLVGPRTDQPAGRVIGAGEPITGSKRYLGGQGLRP